jgi:ribosomal protein L9
LDVTKYTAKNKSRREKSCFFRNLLLLRKKAARAAEKDFKNLKESAGFTFATARI